jgi:uncharacterized protein
VKVPLTREGTSQLVPRNEILLPDRQSAELSAADRAQTGGAVNEIPLEDERAGEPKTLVVLHGYGHYGLHRDPAFGEVMEAAVAWDAEHIPPRSPSRGRTTVRTR